VPSEDLDPLYTRVAKKVLTETLRVKKGDSLTVETWESGLPFARRALAEARAMGCTAVMIYEDEWAYVEGVRRGPEDTVGLMGKNEYGLLSGTDAYIFIPGQALDPLSKTLSHEERARATRYNASWYEAAQKARLRGARLSFGYVGRDLAKALGKDVRDVVRGRLNGALVDFTQISRSASKVSSLLADGASSELMTMGTTLRFSLKGEITVEDGVIDDGDLKRGNNMAYIPPGFVSKEVDPVSAEGSIVLTDSLTDYGVVSRVRLEFKEGKVVSWGSTADEKLKKLFDAVPREKRRLESLTVGLNPRLKYGLGQDRLVEGALNIGGFGFRGLVKRGTLRVEGFTVVADGRLAP
jgi:leucyl aminopeptidase (aminopeptidase T)